MCFLRVGQEASPLVGTVAGRQEGRGKHGLPGLEDATDLLLEPPRLLDLGARAPARVEVGLHTLQRVGQPALFLQEEGPQLRRERARDAARHAGTQHLVELVALFVRAQAQRRDTVVEEGSEVVTRGAEDLHAPTEASSVFVQFTQLGNDLVVSLRQQQHVLQANIRVETGDDERRRLDRWLGLAVQVHARDEPMIGCEGEVDGGIGGSARFTESSPDAFVPAGRARLSEISEAQP